VPSDHLLEQQLQDKLLEQYRNEPPGAGGADARPVHGLRTSGSGSRFAKYGDGDAGEGRENESSLAAFYARNKIVILVTGVIFCVLLGVLIWVLVCHRKKRAAQALLPAMGPLFGAADVPPYVGPVVFDNNPGRADSVSSWGSEV
jgi:cbb3-type cytochrome oxidase subunit 3